MLIDPAGKPIIPHQAKLFPLTWNFGESSVTLYADGTCDGDLQGVLEFMADLQPDPNGPMLWLLANAVANQLRNGPKPATVQDFMDTLN